MKTYRFEIQEVQSRIIEIEANNEDEAYQKIKNMYRKEEIILNSSDFVETEIKKFENE